MTQLNRRSTAATRLGFIGLGYMGSRLSKRLVDAGYSVTVYDRDPYDGSEFLLGGVERPGPHTSIRLNGGRQM